MAVIFTIMLRMFFAACLLLTSLSGMAQKGLTEIPVSIKDGWFTAKTISFDLFHTGDRKNGIDHPADLPFIKAADAAFSFVLVSDSNKVHIQVLKTPHVAFSDRSLPSFLDHMPATAVFSYVLIIPEDSSHWEMILKDMTYLELNDNKQAGILHSPGEEIKITANNHMGTVNSYENIRYEFVYRRKVIAAVIAGAKPRVWIDTELIKAAQRPIIAAAIAALLLR